MSVYLLSFNLVDETARFDYEPLWAELDSFDAQRTQDCTWLVETDSTPLQVLRHFRPFLNRRDRFWVARVRAGEYQYVNALAGTTDFLRRGLRLPAASPSTPDGQPPVPPPPDGGVET